MKLEVPTGAYATAAPAPSLHRFRALTLVLSAASTPPPTRRALARLVADDLAGAAGERLLDVAARFRQAAPEHDDDVAWAQAALEARIALERVALTLDDAALLDRLDELDAGLHRARSALLLIDADRYAEVTQGELVDRRAWWGWRCLVDECVPAEMAEHALREIRLGLS